MKRRLKIQEKPVNDKALREHLVNLLSGRGAHVDWKASFSGVPPKLRSVRPSGLPYSIWELLEHVRIAQWDILEFSRDAKHVSPDWPAGYWPKGDAPPSAKAWNDSVAKFRLDLAAMQALVSDSATDLFARIPHGEGQTILREALLLADHNSYHLGQLILLRRLLGAWKDK